MHPFFLPRLLSVILFVLTNISPVFSQLSTDSEEIKKIIQDSFGKFIGNDPAEIGDITVELKANGDREIAGPMKLFGKPGIRLSGTLRQDRTPARFQIQFPESAVINLENLETLSGGSLKPFLPDFFPFESGILIRSLQINLDNSGYNPEKVVLTFSNNRSYGLLAEGKLNVEKTDLDFIIDQPRTPQRKVTGQLKGLLRLGNATINLGATLSGNKADIRFTGSVNGLSLQNLLQSIGGSSVANSVPPSLAQLELRNLKVDISPSQKALLVMASSSAGEVELRMSPGKKNGGRMNLLIGIAPPSSFRFSGIDPALGLLDGINLSGTSLVLSDYAGEMETVFSSFAAAAGNARKIVPGLNLFTHIRVGDELGRFLGRPDLDLSGSLDKSMNVVLESALSFDNLRLADGISFKEVKFGLGFRPGSARVNFRLNGRVEALIKGDLLSFLAGFDFAPADVQLRSFFLMEAIRKANGQQASAVRNAQQEMEPPEWNEPFGVKGVGLRKLGFSMGVSPKSPVFLSSLGISADVRLGINPDFKKNISGAFNANLDIANPLNSMLDIKLQNLTIIGMIDAFRPQANLSGTLRNWLDWGLENAYLRIVPETRTYLPDNKLYERGVMAGGTLKLGGLAARAELAVSDAGFGFKAMVDPIVYSSGGFTWFALKGFEQGERAQASLQLNSSSPELLIDGSVTVLGISSRTSIRVNNTGARFKVQGDAANGAFNASLEVEAQQLSATGGFRVKAEFNNRLQNEVVRQLIEFIKRESARSQAAYSNAQNSLQNARNAAGTDAEKGLIDAANGFVSAFKEIDKGMAVAGQYVVKGLIGDAINIHRIFFETNLNKNEFTVVASIDMTITGQRITQTATIDLNVASATAMAERIVNQIGNAVIAAFENAGSEIEKGWNSFVQGADQFFNNAGKGVVQLVKDFERAGVAAVNWIQGAAMTIYNWGDETFNGRQVEAPNAGSAPSFIPFNVTRYTVTITGIRVDRIPSTNLGITTHYPDGNELEIFGSITIIPGGRLWTNKGSNMFGMNRRQGDNYSIARGNTYPLSTVKYFYAKDADAAGSYLTLYTHLFDNDDQNIFTSAFVANEEMRNTSRISLNGLLPGQSRNGQITAYNRDQDHGVTVMYQVTAMPKVSDSEMIGAVNNRNAGLVETTIRRGGNPFINGLMQTAIRNNDAATALVLGRYGVAVSPADMQLAVSSAPGMIEHLVRMGGVVSKNELQKAIEMKNASLVSVILSRGVQPDAVLAGKAIQSGDINITRLLLQKNVLLGANELGLALQQGNPDMIGLVLKSGAVPTQAQLISSVQKKQEPIIRLLMTRIVPGHESLQEAANQNNVALFRLLAGNGGTLQNNQPVFRSIDHNNSELLLSCLRAGGNPTEALKYAAQKNNAPLVQVCLDNRADPSAAVGFAVRSNNINLVSALLQQYRVSPNECMKEAILHNNTAAAQAALATGRVSANSFMAAAAEKNNLIIVQGLADSKGDPNLALPAAVRNNNTELAGFLLNRGARASNDFYIRQAVQKNSMPMVQLLVNYGASTDAGMPVAVSSKNAVMVKYLLDKGAAPFGYLRGPAGDGHAEIVKLLLDKGANPDEGIGAAVNGNHTAVVRLLLIAGANPMGLIQVPAAKNNMEMVSDLLRSGANPNPGMRPAVDGNFTPLVRLLLESGASAKGYMQKPASIGNLEMVRILLEKNAVPDEGIEAAIRGNHTAVIKLLVNRGADGKRFLALPAGFGNLEIVELLLSKGAAPETGMRAAVDKGHAAVTAALIKAGADGSKKEYMDISVSRNFAPMVPVLVHAGNRVDSTVVDQRGRTHLHNAAELDNSFALVTELLKAGSSVHAPDHDGNTPLHLSVDEGKDDIETVRALLQAGADPCAENKKGRNIFKQAKGNKVKKLIKEFGGSRKCSGG